MSRIALLGVGVLALAACQDSSAPIQPDEPAPTLERAPSAATAPASQRVPNRYIVVFKDGPTLSATAEAQRMVAAHQARLHFTYQHALKGFAAELAPAAAAALRADPKVAFVEQDRVVHVDGIQTSTPSWGLDRIDQRALPLSTSYTSSSDGSGVRIYGIDTGIRQTHTDFGGRAVGGFTAVNDGRGTTDCFGHGTHTAGTAAGSSYGVAKGATLVAVRVFDCVGFGFTSQIIAGVDWVTQNAVKPAVANISLGVTPVSAALDQAVTNSINAGVVYAVSAGNDQTDACGQSPASVPAALTVAASGITDAEAIYSNFGSCVDLFGPGDDISSDWSTSDNATNTISGTSMSAPHVAGAAALYLQLNPSATPAQVAQALTTNATLNRITNLGGVGTPNRLLYTGFLLTNAWVISAPVPTARYALAAGVVNGVLYAIGGEEGAGPGRTVESYTPGTNRWTTRAPLPQPRSFADGAGVINGVLYVAGGFSAPGTLSKSLFAYAAGSNTWSTKAPMPIPSACGVVGVLGGQLYATTGCAAGGAFANRLHRYDPATNTWTARAAPSQTHSQAAGAALNGTFYLVGGLDGAGAVSNTLEAYDPASNSWSTKASMPTARYGAGARVINGKLYVVGGTDGALAYSNRVEAYNPATNSWTATAAMPTARTGLAAGVINGLLYAVGGANTARLAAAEAYKP